MKLLCFVAHPDDCVIFAMPFISRSIDQDWTIVYLTGTAESERGQEVVKFWQARGVKTRFLGYKDIPNIVPMHWKAQQTATEIETADLILTHHWNGEYGHVHHMFVYEVAELIDTPKIYFRLDALSNFTCENILSYTLDELPLHSQVIQMFENRNTGKYYIPLETQGDPTWKKLQLMM